MAEPRRVSTARLQLDAIAPTDLSALFPVVSDAARWLYAPASPTSTSAIQQLDPPSRATAVQSTG